jgi:hydrogenase maturation protease
MPFSDVDGTARVSGLLVVGIGNPDRGDDAIGPIVARLLAGRVAPDVVVLERSGDMVGLIEDWSGRDGVILIDAAAMVKAPGTVYRFDLLHDVLPTGLTLASTHAFGVADAVALARALGRLPGRLIIYAVEGTEFAPGAAPGAPVVAAAEPVAVRIAEELDRWADLLQS